MGLSLLVTACEFLLRRSAKLVSEIKLFRALLQSDGRAVQPTSDIRTM